MKTIYDPVNRWLSAAPLALAPGNKRPVALDDTLNVLIGSGPVTVNVLANDFDPEGAPLTLISASAALGSAVAEANNTVTYTPPPIAGFDTVTYEIADDLDQRQFGQINVTISDLELTIDVTPNNTLVVNAESGMIDITVTDPAALSGTYQADVSDLIGGPINLVVPTITGTIGVGQVLTANAGLWVFDTGAGTPVQSWQWRRASTDIPGATADTYTVTAADIGQGLAVRETLIDQYGQRSAISPVVGASFLPSDDTQLVSWWDASDTGTITTEGANQVSVWADKTGGAALTQTLGLRQPSTGTRVLNGTNVLDFDGARFMECAETLPASGDVAFHMVLVIDGTANAFEAILAVDATNDFQIDANNVSQFDGRLNAAGIGAPVNLSGGPFSGAMILSIVFERTGAALAELFIGNVSRASMAYTTAIDANAALHLMTNRSRNAWVNGAVAELIVTGDTANRTDYHAYLTNKWGLS